MKILAIDPSTTSTGVATFEGEKITYWGRFAPSKDLDVILRSFEIAKKIEQLIEVDKPDLIVIETPFSRNRHGLEVQNRMIGMLEFVFCEKEIPFEYVHPKSIYRIFGLKGNAKREEKKEVSIKFINETFKLNLSAKDDDIADAIVIGLYQIKENKRREEEND